MGEAGHMRVELTRFKIRAGKENRVDEWLSMLNTRMPETLETLERERMLVEVIFRERVDGVELLSWFSIQREGGESVLTSEHEIDKLHIEFWRECIDDTYGAFDAIPQVVMVPDSVAKAMGWSDPADAARPWTGASTWHDMTKPREERQPARDTREDR